MVFRPLPPEQFARFNEPGYVKIAWTLRADPAGETRSVFRTETRVVATDPGARTKFRRYWSFASPGIVLIRWLIATTVNDEVVKLRDLERVTSILVTDQIRDAVYVARHEATEVEGRLKIRAAGDAKSDETTFMVLHEGRIYFQGTVAALLASRDAYLKEFLFMTLPPW